MNIEATNVIDGVQEGLDSKCSILERKLWEVIILPEFETLTVREIVGCLELLKMEIAVAKA